MDTQHEVGSASAASAVASANAAAASVRESAQSAQSAQSAHSSRTGAAVGEPGACHLSTEQLEVALAAVTDGIIGTDRHGRIRVMSAVAQRLLALDDRAEIEGLSLSEWLRARGVRDERGHLLPEERLLTWRERLQAGKTLSREDIGEISVRGHDGQAVGLSVSAAPERNARGKVVGALWIVRDASEPRRQRRRMREALTALVAMAEMLVDAKPSEMDGVAGEMRAGVRGRARGAPATAGMAARGVAQRLAELARRVMQCRILDIIAEQSPESGLYLVASAGLSARALRRWRTTHPGHGQGLHDLLPPDIASRLERGQSIVIDSMRPEFASLPNPLGARSALVAPMRLGGRLVGFLVLGYWPEAHTFTDEEIALAAGTARMAALVLERERLLCEREEARASMLALRETNRRMDEFIAVAAHELRAPVQASLLGVGLATQHARSLGRPITTQTGAGTGEPASEVEELRKDLAQTEESVERLARLVGELLDVSRLQTGQINLRLQPMDLTGAVRETVERQRLLTPERAFGLHLPRRETLLVEADVGRISQVIGNLLTNAVKYAPEDQPVEVRVQVRGQRARVSVRDEGPGLSADEQRRVWDRYHQAAGIQANPGTGTGLGLGLYVARQIVRAHGGQVGVHSVPGKGATFWFTLPLMKAEEWREPPGQ
jgi:signal transduction histidine kinase/PAS domain-containing protein